MKPWRVFFSVAGLFNIAGGTWGFFHPARAFTDLGLAPPRYPFLLQLLFLAVVTLGVGYLVAARDPLRHRPLIAVGAATKAEGAAMSYWAIHTGQLPPSAWWQPVVNDLVWLVGFVAFLIWARGRNAGSVST